jgi:hypothetical protein
MKTQSKEREEAILKVLERGGKLDARSIGVRAEMILGVDSYPKQSLYRMLSKLIDQEEICFEELAPDGSVIATPDHQYKNPRKLYFHPSHKSGVPGNKALEELGGKIITPKILFPFMNIFDGKQIESDSPEIFMSFILGQELLTLRMDMDIIKTSVLIARKSENKEISILEALKENFSGRTSLLELPCPKLSSYKLDNESGHCKISFEDKDNVLIEDLGSSNGTNIYKLDPENAKKMRIKGELLGTSTMTSSWLDITNGKPLALIKNKPESLSYPFILELGDELMILIEKV